MRHSWAMRRECAAAAKLIVACCLGGALGLGCDGERVGGSRTANPTTVPGGGTREGGDSGVTATTQDPALSSATDCTVAPHGDTAAVPAGCEDVLVPRAELPRCDDVPACEQAFGPSSRTTHWLLVLERYYDDAEGKEFELSSEAFARHTRCVVQQLERLGASVEVSQFGDLELEAGCARIASVLRTTAIDSVEVRCTEADCLRCATLTETDCRADGFCWPMEASRLDAERSCIERRYAGCERRHLDCGSALTTAVGLDGACWMFGSTCQPSGFRGSDTTSSTCGYAQFEDVPRCE